MFNCDFILGIQFYFSIVFTVYQIHKQKINEQLINKRVKRVADKLSITIIII